MKKIINTFALILILASPSLFAEVKSQDAMKLTPEQRLSMAGIHEKMATCLRSEKIIGECREEMKASCVSSIGKDQCNMMGMHKHASMKHNKNHVKSE